MFSLVFNSFAFKNFFVQRLGKGTWMWRFIEAAQGVSFRVNYWLYYKTKIIKSKTTITEINIEFVSYCNLRCKLCSLDHEKPKVRMSAETLKHFFEDFLSDKRFRSVKTIHLYNAGEVLLHPRLEEMLAIIAHYKQKANNDGIRFPVVALLTNATVLDAKHTGIILRAGVLDNIRFSMDGGSKEKFEEIRLRAKWEEFVHNITLFCAENRRLPKPITTGIITLIEYEHKLKTSWMSAEFKALLNMVDGFELRYAHNWAGEVEVEELKNGKIKNYKTGCSLLMHQLVLLPNGDITVCCADLNSKGVIGNIKNQKIFDIYNAEKRYDMLTKFIQGKKNEITLCKDCETF